MKKSLLMIALFTIVVFNVYAQPLWEQQTWTMAIISEASDTPAIETYHGHMEKGDNGTEYYRIYNASKSIFYDKDGYMPLPYGYRMADKKIMIYDFNSKKESIAIDFNLSVGDKFTTLNGMDWIVESVKDTLVKTIVGEVCVSKRLLNVKTVDGKMNDQWLEDFGSFTNHFMIKDMKQIRYSQTLWMRYAFGEYIAREITSGIIYGHDSGHMEGHYNQGNMDTPDVKCTYENGVLKFENVQWWWPHRDYTCFYREGDNIYKVNSWEFEPFYDSAESSLKRDIITFENLQMPVSGQYTIHIGNNEYSTSIRNVPTHHAISKGMYNLQGHQIMKYPAKGIYIEDGKKKLATE